MWELDYKESWAPTNWCFWTVVLEEALESPLDCKEIQPVHPKGNQSWIYIGRTDAEANSNIVATWCEELTHLKRPWCWERLKAGGEGDNRGWDGWMASLTQQTWVWASSGSWWWTGKPGVLSPWGQKELDTTERLTCWWSYDCEWCNGNESLGLLHIYPCPLLILSFPGGSSGKESACNVGVLVLIPGLGRSPGEGNSYPLQYSGLVNRIVFFFFLMVHY